MWNKVRKGEYGRPYFVQRMIFLIDNTVYCLNVYEKTTMLSMCSICGICFY